MQAVDWLTASVVNSLFVFQQTQRCCCVFVVWRHLKAADSVSDSRCQSWEQITAHSSAPKSCHIFVVFMTRLVSERHHFFVPCQNMSQRLWLQLCFFCLAFCLWSSPLSLRGLLVVVVFLLADCWQQTWRCEDTLLSVRLLWLVCGSSRWYPGG